MIRLRFACRHRPAARRTLAFAQTVGPCPGNVGSAAVSKPSWVLFDLGSAVLKPEAKPTIAEAATTAKARQATKVCVVGQTDKLGDKNYNAKLASSARRPSRELSRRLSGEGRDDRLQPEAFGNMSSATTHRRRTAGSPSSRAEAVRRSIDASSEADGTHRDRHATASG